jgi:hypothetical protein
VSSLGGSAEGLFGDRIIQAVFHGEPPARFPPVGLKGDPGTMLSLTFPQQCAVGLTGPGLQGVSIGQVLQVAGRA